MLFLILFFFKTTLTLALTLVKMIGGIGITMHRRAVTSAVLLILANTATNGLAVVCLWTISIHVRMKERQDFVPMEHAVKKNLYIVYMLILYIPVRVFTLFVIEDYMGISLCAKWVAKHHKFTIDYNIMNEDKIISDNCVHNFVDHTLFSERSTVLVFGGNVFFIWKTEKGLVFTLPFGRINYNYYELIQDYVR